MDAMQATKYVTVAMPVKVSATANDQKLYTKHGVIRDGGTSEMGGFYF